MTIRVCNGMKELPEDGWSHSLGLECFAERILNLIEQLHTSELALSACSSNTHRLIIEPMPRRAPPSVPDQVLDIEDSNTMWYRLNNENTRNSDSNVRTTKNI